MQNPSCQHLGREAPPPPSSLQSDQQSFAHDVCRQTSTNLLKTNIFATLSRNLEAQNAAPQLCQQFFAAIYNKPISCEALLPALQGFFRATKKKSLRVYFTESSKAEDPPKIGLFAAVLSTEAAVFNGDHLFTSFNKYFCSFSRMYKHCCSSVTMTYKQFYYRSNSNNIFSVTNEPVTL